MFADSLVSFQSQRVNLCTILFLLISYNVAIASLHDGLFSFRAPILLPRDTCYRERMILWWEFFFCFIFNKLIDCLEKNDHQDQMPWGRVA